jgi:hypothetical protein
MSKIMFCDQCEVLLFYTLATQQLLKFAADDEECPTKSELVLLKAKGYTGAIKKGLGK